MTPEEIMKVVLFFLTVAGSGWAIWWRIEGKAKAAEDKAAKVSEDLSEFKLRVSETYATKQGMQEQTTQLLRAIEGVGNRIDGLHERLDRAFERTTGRATRS